MPLKAAKNSIFICYRRDDSSETVGRIYDNLATEFGDEAVFRDVDKIPLGVDFRVHIQQCLKTCRVGLVVIGPDWEGLEASRESPRLGEPSDHVRIECETMLKTENIVTIPCFVRGISSVKLSSLPAALESLAFINGVQIRRDPDFHNDLRVLKKRLHECLTEPVPASPEAPVATARPSPVPPAKDKPAADWPHLPGHESHDSTGNNGVVTFVLILGIVIWLLFAFSNVFK
jgi:hypothetical protein